MSLRSSKLTKAIALAAACAMVGLPPAEGELRWQSAKKEALRLRLVALSWNHPRSSEFANEEIFIAEKELAPKEWKLVKLVYAFMPYQPRLSDYGLDHETVHEMRAVRDATCDETLASLTSGRVGDWRSDQNKVQYSTDAEELNVERPRTPLPCYQTSADDYEKSVQKPAKEE
jgi:hypothetical protein